MIFLLWFSSNYCSIKTTKYDIPRPRTKTDLSVFSWATIPEYIERQGEQNLKKLFWKHIAFAQHCSIQNPINNTISHQMRSSRSKLTRSWIALLLNLLKFESESILLKIVYRVTNAVANHIDYSSCAVSLAYKQCVSLCRPTVQTIFSTCSSFWVMLSRQIYLISQQQQEVKITVIGI